jgi:hypothetical protein
VPFPGILEVAFANCDRYKFTQCEELFPTPLDQADVPENADLFLRRCKF